MGCAGDPDILTPNIDALAAHGVRFENTISPFPEHAAGAHAFLTGDAPSRFSPGTPSGVSPSERLTLVEALRDSGYTTAAIGALDLSETLARTCFDEVVAMGCAGIEDGYRSWLKEKGKPEPASHPVEPVSRLFPLGETYHPTTWTGNCAVRYCQNAPEPFFLWVSFPRPRPPFDPPAPWNRMYRPSQLHRSGVDPGVNSEVDADARKLLAAYYGCISQVDRQIGRVLATLTARGRTRNMFLLTAGSGLPVSSAVEADKMVNLLPDSLVRIPLLIAGHASQRKGAVDPALISLGDLVPTLLELLGIMGPPSGGRSFYRQLLDSGIPHRQAVVTTGRSGASCLRTARYKWISHADAAEDTLFDLQADPFELHNLSGGRQSLAIRKMLMGLVHREMQ